MRTKNPRRQILALALLCRHRLAMLVLVRVLALQCDRHRLVLVLLLALVALVNLLQKIRWALKLIWP